MGSRLVFCLVRLQALSLIMAFLIAVSVCNLAHILGWTILVSAKDLKGIDSDSWDRIFRILFLGVFLAMIAAVFFLSF